MYFMKDRETFSYLHFEPGFVSMQTCSREQDEPTLNLLRPQQQTHKNKPRSLNHCVQVLYCVLDCDGGKNPPHIKRDLTSRCCTGQW